MDIRLSAGSLGRGKPMATFRVGGAGVGRYKCFAGPIRNFEGGGAGNSAPEHV